MLRQIKLLSRNLFLKDHLKVYLDHFLNKPFSIITDNSDCDLWIIDTITCLPSDLIENNNKPVILYTEEVKPFLLEYINEFEVCGVISFQMELNKIKRTLEAAQSKEVFFDEEMLSLVFSKSTNQKFKEINNLTSREVEILKLTYNDKSNEEIASELKLSIRTVNSHKGNIIRKTGVNNLSGLIQLLHDYSVTFRIQS